MSYKAIFDEAIAKIKNQETELYSGGIYTTEQVIRIVTHLYDRLVVGGVTGDSGNVIVRPEPAITKEMYDNLVERIDEHVTDAISSVDTSDVVDESSIVMTVCGGRATLDNISVNTDEIASQATWGLSDKIEDWTEEWGIQIMKEFPKSIKTKK